jgi:hypothetical protein
MSFEWQVVSVPIFCFERTHSRFSRFAGGAAFLSPAFHFEK